MSPSRDEDLDWLYGRDRRQVAAGTHPSDAKPVGECTSPTAEPGTVPSARSQPAPDRATPTGTTTARRPASWIRSAGWSGGPQPSKPGKQRHPVRNAFRVLLILFLLLILWLVGVPAYAWTQIARVDAAPSGQRPADQPGKTFLLVGSDSRAGLSKAEQKRLGTGSTAGQRTDTIMLVYVPPGGKPALISRAA